MIVYLPPISKEFLDGGNGATGFTPSAETPDIGATGCPTYREYIVPQGIEVPLFTQGHRLVPTDLNVVFFDSAGKKFSPFSLTYSVGFLTGTDLSDFHPIGSQVRIPAGIRVGRFHPNFQIGDKWVTGKYIILWKYRVSETSDEETTETLFLVGTDGVSDVKPKDDGGYSDIQATVVVGV